MKDLNTVTQDSPVLDGRRPSRRTIAKGAAWSVPAVAFATSVPAYAVTGENCYPVNWSSSFTCGTAGGTVPVTSTTGNSGTVRVTTGVTTGYNIECGTTYNAYRHMQVANGQLAMATWRATNTATDPSRYEWVTLAFPADATGPMSFCVTNINSYPTATRDGVGSGANYYTDSVQVLNGSTVVAPVVTSATVSYAGGWAAGTGGTTAGQACYTVQDPAQGITIRLRNAAPASGSGNPNQNILISAISCGTYQPPPPPPPTLHVFATAAFGRRRLDFVANSNDRCYRASGSTNYQASGTMFTNEYPATSGRELDNITIGNCANASTVSNVSISFWSYFNTLTWTNTSTDANTSCWSQPTLTGATQSYNGATYYEYRSTLSQSCVATCFVPDGQGGLTLQGLSGSCGFRWYSNCQIYNTSATTRGTQERTVNVTSAVTACGAQLTAQRGWGEMSI